MCKLFSTRLFHSDPIFILHFTKINNEFYKPLISRHFILPCYDLFGCFLNTSTSDLKSGCQSSAQFGHTSFSSAGNRGKSTASLSFPPPFPVRDTLCAAAETHVQVLDQPLKRFGFGKILLGAALFQSGCVLFSSCATLHLAVLKCFPFLSFLFNQARFTR